MRSSTRCGSSPNWLAGARRTAATIARRTETGWRLSGRKIYSTGAPILKWYAVWARTDEPEPRVGMFLVPAGLPGTWIVETWDHLGLRASGSHDVVFEDVVFRSIMRSTFAARRLAGAGFHPVDRARELRRRDL